MRPLKNENLELEYMVLFGKSDLSNGQKANETLFTDSIYKETEHKRGHATML